MKQQDFKASNQTCETLKPEKNNGLYIGLPNFKFRHATDEFTGFVGRTKIQARLKALLSGSGEDKSTGAYLITGSRGVGKTSFVNKVKSEVEQEHNYKFLQTPIWVFIGVLFLNMLYNLLLNQTDKNVGENFCKIITVGFWCIFAIIFTYTAINTYRIATLNSYRKAPFKNKVKEVAATFLFLDKIKIDSRLVYFMHMMVIASIIEIFAICLWENFSKESWHLTLSAIYGSAYLFYFTIVAFKKKKTDEEFKNKTWHESFWSITKQLIWELVAFIVHRIKGARKIFIKINLGHDDLKVIDVLRLVSHYIYIEYRKYLYSGLTYILRISIVVFTALAITKFLNYIGVIESLKLCFEDYVLNEKRFSNNVVDCYEHLYSVLVNSVTNVWKLATSISVNNTCFSSGISTNIKLNIYEFICFCLLLLLYKLFSILPYIRMISTPFKHLNELKDLICSISASIKREEGLGIKDSIVSTRFSINKKIEKTYPMSDERDIEKKLIDVLDKISRSKFHRIRFILIFDELDKIESVGSDKQEDSLKSDTFSPDTIRKRREAVYSLLSGLKYLLTTMKAKFIFIAGRELYEAFKADASDRSHYLSSIFNDVIVVPSLMADDSDDKKYDIFSMTEQYVCRNLIPSLYRKNEKPVFYLEDYQEFLYDALDNEDEEEKKYIIQKTLIVLHNFIVYLTYASKGAPKKMVNLFERHVIDRASRNSEFIRIENQNKTDRCIDINSGDYAFCLRFDYYDMYMFALTSRIVLPVVYRFERGEKHKYGDKLLVTSMFFLDHLYKFHRNSFSWRALEASPEIIDVNKVPELREHITDILHYISQNDLKNISNGLYDFRFYKRIAQEISFLTRVSETAAAIFNFTLDETYSVKQYYLRKLDRIRQEYDSDKIPPQNTVIELASIHFTLGELYLYEEEVGDAIVEFNFAVSMLHTIKPTDMTSEHIVLLMKATLSLGIAYEKQNQNDRAMLMYIECTKFLIASKNTDIKYFGLETIESAVSNMRMIVYTSPLAPTSKEPELYFRNISSTDDKSLIEAVDDVNHMHPVIHNFLSKIAAFDTLRLLYLPILAKLQILEKVQTGGLQPTDLKRAIKEFSYLANMMNKENKNVLIANFFLKIGDILYYKNSEFLNGDTTFEKLFKDYFIKEDYSMINHYKEDAIINMPVSNNSKVDYTSEQSIRQYPDAYHFYRFALHTLLEETFSLNNEASLMDIIGKLKELHEKKYISWDENKFLLLGSILTNLGDCVFAYLNEKQKNCTSDEIEETKMCLFNFLCEYVNLRKMDKQEEQNSYKRSIIDILSDLLLKGNDKGESLYAGNEYVKIFVYYIMAYLYFKKGTSNNMANFQCYRLLIVLKYNLPNIDSDELRSKLNNIIAYLTECSIAEKGASFKEMHFENIADWIRIFDSKEYHYYNAEALLNSRDLLYDETLETILAYLSIKLYNIKDKANMEAFNKMFHSLRFDNIGSILNRIKWLKFISDVNLRNLGFLLNVDSTGYYAKDLDKIESKIMNLDDSCKYIQEREKAYNIIHNAIDKLFEAINLIKLYGENFALTNFYVADIYHRMLRLLEWERTLVRKWPELKDKDCNVGGYYCSENYSLISWTNVNRYYYKAKEMHSEGRTYKDMVNRSCFLNDEFSDQRFHFITAHERWNITKSDFNGVLKGDISKPILECYSIKNYTDNI